MLQSHTVTAEFSLGLAPLSLYSNATAMRECITGGRLGRGEHRQALNDAMPASVLAKSSNTSPLALSLEFTEGTPCDIVSGLVRSSTIEVACGAKDGIVDILEDRTCHYLVRVQSVALCNHKAFVAEEEAFSLVELMPTAPPSQPQHQHQHQHQHQEEEEGGSP